MNKENSLSKIPYRLGVDIGTASVAWAAMALSTDDKPERLLASGVTIFGEPVLPKEMKLKNEERRTARLMRRQTERKRERMSKIMHLVQASGVRPDDLAGALKVNKHTQNLWQLRVRALDSRVDLAEFFLISLRLAKNRGYNGEAPAANKKGELGKVGQALAATQQMIASAPGARTVAEALWHRERHQSINQKSFRKLSDNGTYILRRDVRKEFDLILAEQRKHHPILNQPLDSVFGIGFSEKLARDQHKAKGIGTKYFWGYTPETIGDALTLTLFYQKPLQGFKDKIGLCSLDKVSLRVVAAHPAHQVFRMEKLLADLRWGDTKTGEALTTQQKNVIREKLLTQKEAKFSALYKTLVLAGCMQPDGLLLNFHTPRRDHIKGHTTKQVLVKFNIWEFFEALTLQQQSDVFIALADDINAPEAWGHDGTKDAVTALYGAEVTAFIDRLAVGNSGLDRLRAMDFDAGRTSYGAAALQRLSVCMREEGVDERSAMNKLYPDHATVSAPDGVLPLVSELELRSPVVNHALEYTRRELVGAIKRLGLPQSMVVELAKDVKSTLEERSKTTSRQNFEEKANADARREIVAANCRVTNTSILRYKLWKQQAKRCPYSGQAIFSIEDALNGAKFEIEHIVPKRLHGVGNRFEDVVLASKQFNGIKGGDETPHTAAVRVGTSVWNWEATEQAVKAIEKDSADFKRHKAKIILDKTKFEARGLDDNDFVDRQLQETQWIGRVVSAWCKRICTDVTVVRGGLTADLRRDWQLDSVLEQVRISEGRHDSEKAKTLFYKPNRVGELKFDKRCDHRQHLIDACVIALSTRNDYVATVKARNARATGRKAEFKPPHCPIPSLREHLVRMLTGYVVWQVPDHLVNGAMFDQPFGIGLDRKTLYKGGKKDRRSFNPKVDRVFTHKDRQERQHHKALVKTETACFLITQDEVRPINIPDFRKNYLRGTKTVVPDGQRLLFKGDLISFPSDPTVYRIGYFTEKAARCVDAVETGTFDELNATGLNKSIGKIADLLTAKIFKHPIELALHSRSFKAAKVEN